MKAVDLSKKIFNHSARVSVVGIGYVGSHIAETTSSAGFTTIGIDIDDAKVERINSQNAPLFTASANFASTQACDIVVIAVQTPLTENQTPNLEFLKSAVSELTKYLHTGQLIILESSVAPGTTRNVVLPILVGSGLIAGEDFFLSFSPERIDPGNRSITFAEIPKVVSGLEPVSLTYACQFYSQLVKKVVPVTSLETAEMTKILENTFRLVNISLVNELTTYTQHLGINMWEVVDAAATKPYGFLPHYPGPGVGGDCIPVLPHHLLASARDRGVKLPLVNAATKVNTRQPQKVAAIARKVLNGKRRRESQILLVGVAYKADVADIRESAALRLWELLTKQGMRVSYHDPLVPQYNGASSQPLTPRLIQEQDLTIITTAHSRVDYDLLVKAGRPILDTRNILKGYEGEHIYRL